MFRCHFTKRARIVQGENLAAKTLVEAIAECQRLIAAKHHSDQLDGVLIWEDSPFQYTSPAPE
jgi:hypothetical protein